MATRMQRYKNDGLNRRSQRNKELYKDIYEYGEYSNIEGITSMGKTNEVDIEKVKALLESRDDSSKRRVKAEIKEMKDEPVFEEKGEEKNYDIRDILSKARETMPKDDKERVLRDSKYEFLNKVAADTKKDDDDGDLKELINTITSTSMLNKLSDEALAGELFGDLIDDEKKSDSKSLKEYIKETENKALENSLDKSFFTSSLNLSKSDFISEEKKKTSVVSIIIIIILVIFIVLCSGVLIYKNFM